jgi:NADH-quinone oxidoreductase subunit J
MVSPLFAEAETTGGILSFLKESWPLLVPPALGFAAIYLMLPKARRSVPLVGGFLAAAALVLGAAVLVRTQTFPVESVLFFAFSGIAIAAGVMMLVQRNPVHAALSFALVVLATCGLFLLLAAPFLMAATIIVYAGAIVVTFLFVIMLAQQEGPSSADQRSREPFLACLAGCVLLASLVCILHRTYDTRELDGFIQQLHAVGEARDEAEIKRLLGDPALQSDTRLTADLVNKILTRFPEAPHISDMNRHWARLRVDPANHVEPLKVKAKVTAEALDTMRRGQGSLALHHVPGRDKKTPGHYEPGKLPASNVSAIGRTLFTDYLIPVELAAVLLLVATIGAIAIAGRKSEELR